MELADEKARVLADAELAWVEHRIALLRPDQEDLAQAWQVAGWTVVLLDDTLTLAGGGPWASIVAAGMGLELKNNEE